MNLIKLILITFCFVSLTSCKSSQIKQSDSSIETYSNNQHFIDNDVYDPFEGVNRRVYYLNSKIDKYFLLPITNIYSTYVPNPVQDGIHNFFMNLNEVPIFVNSTLQFKASKSCASFSRFTINSTVGVLGIFDVASKLKINSVHEDFGQTLGFYGVPSGPYLVLPVLGPSNLRDTTGKLINTYTLKSLDPLILMDHSQSEPTLYALKGIDSRANINFQYYHSGSAFEYDYLRFLYSKLQKIEVKK